MLCRHASWILSASVMEHVVGTQPCTCSSGCRASSLSVLLCSQGLGLPCPALHPRPSADTARSWAPDLWRKRPGFEPRPITDSPAVWTCTNQALIPILGFPTCPVRQLTGWSGRTLSWKITAYPKAHCHRVMRGTVRESCRETQVGLQPKVVLEWMEGQSHGSAWTQVRPVAFTSPAH